MINYKVILGIVDRDKKMQVGKTNCLNQHEKQNVENPIKI